MVNMDIHLTDDQVFTILVGLLDRQHEVQAHIAYLRQGRPTFGVDRDHLIQYWENEWQKCQDLYQEIHDLNKESGDKKSGDEW